MLKAIAGPNPTQAAFKVTEDLTRQHVGFKLYTATTSDRVTAEAGRVYSNNEAAYPVYGKKPVEPNAWTRIVLDGHQPFIANTIAEIAEVFPDHDLILSLGCESVLNVPVIVAGEVLGTINILDAAQHFTPARVAAAMALLPFYTMALLATRRV
jgi:GAF domain-containing protein